MGRTIALKEEGIDDLRVSNCNGGEGGKESGEFEVKKHGVIGLLEGVRLTITAPTGYLCKTRRARKPPTFRLMIDTVHVKCQVPSPGCKSTRGTGNRRGFRTFIPDTAREQM